MNPDAAPSLRSLLADFVLPAAASMVDIDVETGDLDLSDAALLHRDAPAERSRLVTRGFRAGAVRSWWTRDEAGELVARTTLFRMADSQSASLAVADCWSDLLAAKVSVLRMSTCSVAVVSELGDSGARMWTAMSFLSVGDVVASIFGCAVATESGDDAVGLCVTLLDAQRQRLTPS